MTIPIVLPAGTDAGTADRCKSQSAEQQRHRVAKTYRDVAIEQMIATVEEAMSRVIDWWGELPMPMKEAIDSFRVQLGAAIDSVEFAKRALDRPAPETPHGEGR